MERAIATIRLIPLGLLALASALGVSAQDRVHAGPVYTAGFPALQIVLDVPQVGQDLNLRVDGIASGAAEKVGKFSETGYGMTAAVVLDVSGSMRGAPLNAIRRALAKFVDDAGPEDRVAVMTVADDSRWDAPWDGGRDQIRAAIQKIQSRGRLTRLYDGMLQAIESVDDAKPARRRLIVISDGHDEGSTHSEADVIAAAGERHIVVDAIGVTRSNPKYLASLQRIAAATEGNFQAAKNEATLEKLVGSGIERMKAAPVATFRAAKTLADGTAHRFQVSGTSNGKPFEAEVNQALPLITAKTGAMEAGSKKQGAASFAWWWLAIAAGLLLLLGAAILRSRRRKQIIAAPVETVEAAPRSAAFAKRQETESPPAPFRAKPEAPAVIETAPAPPAPRPRAATQFTARFPKPAPGQPIAYLAFEVDGQPDQTFAIEKDQTWIGSLPNNQLCLDDDPTVSANHACIVFEYDVLGIYDHHSTNGTKVNNEPVGESRRLLRPGDRISIGKTTLVLNAASQEERPL